MGETESATADGISRTRESKNTHISSHRVFRVNLILALRGATRTARATTLTFFVARKNVAQEITKREARTYVGGAASRTNEFAIFFFRERGSDGKVFAASPAKIRVTRHEKLV